MADLTQTAANVAESSNPSKQTLIAGEAISAGDLVYKLSTDGKLYRALNDSAVHAAVVGIALNSAAAGQPLTYQYAGDVSPGATVAVGEVYGVSVNAGKVAPVADLASTKYRSLFGFGLSVSVIRISLNATGIVKA